MVDYNIVKHCWLCRKRFVVRKIEAKRNYCDDCQSKSKMNKMKEVRK